MPTATWRGEGKFDTSGGFAASGCPLRDFAICPSRRLVPLCRRQEVDEPAHRADQVALVATERLLDDRPPVVLPAGPAVDGRHEPRVDGQRHPEVARPLSLVDRVREARELVELTPEPGPLLEEVPRDRRVARARLLDH